MYSLVIKLNRRDMKVSLFNLKAITNKKKKFQLKLSFLFNNLDYQKLSFLFFEQYKDNQFIDYSKYKNFLLLDGSFYFVNNEIKLKK